MRDKKNNNAFPVLTRLSKIGHFNEIRLNLAMIYHLFNIQTFEMLAVLSGFFNIYLTVIESMWNWLFGMIAVSIYAVIFFHVKLYADMSLQLVFFGLQFYGLYQWHYGGKEKSTCKISKATRSTWSTAIIAFIFLFSSYIYILKAYTDSTTIIIDAFTTSLSLIAQWMMSKKWVEHWWIWIIVNIISIYMYINKNLYFTSILYGIYFFLCLIGYHLWKKQLYHTSSIQKRTKIEIHAT
ncbi:MAG: hypothetical protein A3F12_02195 [Gammaproteobacteria bacterium RIFCSPHIGHO2_12_FULL_38_14]|nr:MAG: hypothetical protein A3F12_02195 [Gammaproteobacteria bacterium RIFCSPHIGHO2_12_FULL_38_14]